MRCPLIGMLSVLWVLAPALPACADHIVLTNGRTIDGEIRAEDEQTVSVQISRPGMVMTERLSRSAIRTWDRAASQGPAYVILPITGVIGAEVTADAIRDALQQARSVHPRFIVIFVDSPGGQVSEMTAIIDALHDLPPEVQVVAYVKRAFSAAAVIAMSCRHIYIMPKGVIGAAVPFLSTPDGPRDVQAKLRSAMEAEQRARVIQAGHDELLLRGMMELDLQIVLSKADGRPVLRTTGAGRVIKSAGQILTLTADEAVDCGLASPAADLADVGRQIAGGPWHAPTRRPWDTVVGVINARRHAAEIRAARQRIRPEFDQIQGRLEQLSARIDAVAKTLDGLKSQCDAELQRIDHDYQQAIKAARSQKDSRAAMERALQHANEQAAAARQHLQQTAAPLIAEARAAVAECKTLQARQDALLATVPAD